MSVTSPHLMWRRTPSRREKTKKHNHFAVLIRSMMNALHQMECDIHLTKKKRKGKMFGRGWVNDNTHQVPNKNAVKYSQHCWQTARWQRLVSLWIIIIHEYERFMTMMPPFKWTPLSFLSMFLFAFWPRYWNCSTSHLILFLHSSDATPIFMVVHVKCVIYMKLVCSLASTLVDEQAFRLLEIGSRRNGTKREQEKINSIRSSALISSEMCEFAMSTTLRHCNPRSAVSNNNVESNFTIFPLE